VNNTITLIPNILMRTIEHKFV